MASTARDTLLSLLVSTYPDLRRRLAGRLGSTELANEALHDTYLKLRRTEIAGELRNPRSYLVTMALNIARNSIRSDSRHLSAAEIDTLLDIPDDAPDPSRAAEARSELAAVERALQGLPPRRRALFRRFWAGNATFKELALEYNLSERTVRHELLLANRHLADATREISVRGLQDRLSQVSLR